jgi:hypothetical protein
MRLPSIVEASSTLMYGHSPGTAEIGPTDIGPVGCVDGLAARVLLGAGRDADVSPVGGGARSGLALVQPPSSTTAQAPTSHLTATESKRSRRAIAPAAELLSVGG